MRQFVSLVRQVAVALTGAELSKSIDTVQNKWLNKTHLGDCREIMRQMIAEGVKVQTVVTSPPYWGLRDYGIKGQIGLEQDPVRYLARMRSVMRLVREVLEDDGTVWLNMGDCYYTPRVNGGIGYNSTINGQGSQEAFRQASQARRGRKVSWLKEKDMVGMPWMLALLLRADGWYLRSDIIWHKKNPMPESVNDRPTKGHEYLFLLSKNERYYYDSDSIKERVSPDTHARLAKNNGVGWGYATDEKPRTVGVAPNQPRSRPQGVNPKASGKYGKPVAGWASGPGSHDTIDHTRDAGVDRKFGVKQNASFSEAISADVLEWRNRRTVWSTSTEPYSGAHFATFPTELIKPCILAGAAPGAVVFDPFMGSGTTAAVAQSVGRQFIGIELKPDYLELQEDRSMQMGLEL